MPEPEGQGTNGPAKKAVKKPAKKAAKRAALKPRPPGSILNNPALAGAQTVVARSVLGQGASGADAPAPLPQASAEQSPAPPPRLQATSVVPAPSQPVEGQGTKEPAPGRPTRIGHLVAPSCPHLLPIALPTARIWRPGPLLATTLMPMAPMLPEPLRSAPRSRE